ncbi:MAG: hypothetical protein CTY35_02960 [Methylotenera sp.]|jgi:hypothetical protein|nr:MAG: hypothetical protein CTY35_02960 [Methylotenera sp.]
MDEATKVLEFFSTIQHLALDPDTYSQNSEVLDSRFKSLVNLEPPKRALNKNAGHTIQPSVTYAIFGSHTHNFEQANGFATSSNRLKVCKLQPDEMLLGWRARMRMVNCLDHDTSVDQLISKLAGQQQPNLNEHDFVRNAATLLGESKDVLIEKHTLSAFFNALEGLRPSKAGIKSIKHQEAYQRHAPFRTGSKSLRFCSTCAEKDFSTFGYSYWRCSHQIPGVLWCSEHNNLLSTHHNFANLKNPHQISSPNTNSDIRSLSQDQIKILKKYAKMAHEILNLASPIDSGAASVALGKQAKAKNFRVSKPGVKTTPSNTLIKVLPKWWLEETFPRVNWISDKYIWTIDGACSPGASRYTTPTLCLLAALFYESPDEAISEILKPREITQERGFEFWASKEIYHEYIAHKGVVSRVAEKLSLPHSTVGLGLLNQGLPGLGKASSTTYAALDFLNGRPLQEACTTHQATAEETSDLIRAGCSKLAFALNKICNEPISSALLEKSVVKKQVTG